MHFLDRLHDVVIAHRLKVVGAAAALALSGLGAGAKIPLDLSFRPLFAEEPGLVAATAAYTEELGEPSGAFIGALLVDERGITSDRLIGLTHLAGRVEALPHVAQVVSLSTARVPVWLGDRWAVQPLVPSDFLADETTPGLLREQLADDPAALRELVSADGRAMVLWARLDLPLEDLAGRTPVIDAFRAEIEAARAEGRLGAAEVHYVGVSVVEAVYARLLGRGILGSVAGLVMVVLLLLLAVTGRVTRAAVVLAAPSVAAPLVLGAMGILGPPLTLVTSVAPSLVLMIGVADGIHLLSAWDEAQAAGLGRFDAGRHMLRRCARPCWWTTLTTAAGFSALLVCDHGALRALGGLVAFGVTVAFVATLLLVPVATSMMAGAPRPTRLAKWADRGMAAIAALVVGRPAAVAASGVLVLIVLGAGTHALRVQQRFNAEVPPEHPVRAAQAALEDELGGFLGPEVVLRRRDGAALSLSDVEAAQAFADQVEGLRGVDAVTGPFDVLPRGLPRSDAARVARELRADPHVGFRVSSVWSADGTAIGVLVRCADIGTDQAEVLVAAISAEGALLPPALEAEVVGPWWLAQRGMATLLDELLVSGAGAALLILPLLWPFLRRRRLLVLSAVTNALPLLAGLGVMGWLGLEVRISTSMMLALGFGLAVDDTIHLLARFDEEALRSARPAAAVRSALLGAGRAVLLTTAVLVGGLGALAFSDLYALRDMGLVGAILLTLALATDVTVLPAAWLLLHRWRGDAGQLRVQPRASFV